MTFNESVRGLAPGAPIDFRGIELGVVTAIKAEINEASKRINIVVELNLYPARLRTRAVVERAVLSAKERIAMMDAMVAHGLRGQLRTGNLLTGQLYIALDFIPGSAPAKITWGTIPPDMPTTPGSLEDLRSSATSIAKKLDKVDYEGISADLKETLKSTTKMMQGLDTTVTGLSPEIKALIADARNALVAAEGALAPDSPVLQDTRATMYEISRAAQAFRVLADYLERHPEALISGKKADDRKDAARPDDSKKGEKK
jgi:paraquat-inducible protein B